MQNIHPFRTGSSASVFFGVTVTSLQLHPEQRSGSTVKLDAPSNPSYMKRHLLQRILHLPPFPDPKSGVREPASHWSQGAIAVETIERSHSAFVHELQPEFLAISSNGGSL